MSTIRTTITLPRELHDQLRLNAFQYRKSLNQTIVDTLRDRVEQEYSTYSIEQKIKDDFAFFDQVAKMGPKVDVTNAVRSERDRDDE